MPRERRDVPWLDTRGGIFYAFWYDEKEKRTERESFRTKDPAIAKTRFARFLVEGPRSARVVGNAGVTATQALSWYDNEHVQPNVVDKQRQRDAMVHLKSHFADTPLHEVDVFASRAYAEARRRGDSGRCGSDGTIRRELNVLVAAANHAVKFHKMKKEHLPTVELPTEMKKKTPWLTKTQVRALLSKADGKLHDFCLLAYYWGARRTSVEMLKKTQIDLQHGRVDLNPPGAPLTVKRKPIVPIYAEIRPTIERLMEASSTEYLFGEPRDFYREFVRLCRDYNITAQDIPVGKEPWPHLLRHSRATHMLMDGEDPYKVAKLLGDTLATVERVYGHHSVDYLKTESTVAEVA